MRTAGPSVSRERSIKASVRADAPKGSRRDRRQRFRRYSREWRDILGSGELINSFDQMRSILATRTTARVHTMNLQHLQLAATDGAFRSCVRAADFITADGWPLVVAAR